MTTQRVFYLKKAKKTAKTNEENIRAAVQEILQNVRLGGEDAARAYARRSDGWGGEIVVSTASIDEAYAKLNSQERMDIENAHQRVRAFAQAQRDSMRDFELTQDGVTMGHKHVPIHTAGCYVPGGRYAHIASAIMSISTAKVAGVKKVIACSPAKADIGIHPSILYTMDLCGADVILALGGVQAIAAMAFGLFSGYEADILVGPGNA